MLVRIRIIKIPPGFVDEHIRKAWVGLEMDATADEGLQEGWVGEENAGGYCVTGVEAVQALLKADQAEAAVFWNNPAPPTSLRFAADCCEVIR